MKDEKDLLQSGQSEQNTQDKDASKKDEKRRLTKKAVMVLVSGIIVVVVLIAVGIAWYTRIVNSYSVTFEVADYDLAINTNSEDHFLLDVYQYSQVTDKHMAPGTVGWLPLEISNTYGQTDVSFTIAVANLMPAEIATHFRIFALKEGEIVNESPVYNKWHYGDALQQEADIYTQKIEDTNYPLYQKYYIDSKDGNAIVDTIGKSGKQTLCIYWEWYWDADRARDDHTTDAATFTFYKQDGSLATWAELITDDLKNSVRTRWNELDTDIGRYPAKYRDAMQFVVYGSGVQVRPSDGNKVTTAEETTAH